MSCGMLSKSLTCPFTYSLGSSNVTRFFSRTFFFRVLSRTFLGAALMRVCSVLRNFAAYVCLCVCVRVSVLCALCAVFVCSLCVCCRCFFFFVFFCVRASMCLCCPIDDSALCCALPPRCLARLLPPNSTHRWRRKCNRCSR